MNPTVPPSDLDSSCGPSCQDSPCCGLWIYLQTCTGQSWKDSRRYNQRKAIKGSQRPSLPPGALNRVQSLPHSAQHTVGSLPSASFKRENAGWFPYTYAMLGDTSLRVHVAPGAGTLAAAPADPESTLSSACSDSSILLLCQLQAFPWV